MEYHDYSDLRMSNVDVNHTDAKERYLLLRFRKRIKKVLLTTTLQRTAFFALV